MSGRRQKIQCSLALEPVDQGETLVSGYEGTEPFWRSQHPKARLPQSN
jgi:hypothetical protein